MRLLFSLLFVFCTFSVTCQGVMRIGIIGDSISVPTPSAVAPYESYHALLQKQFEDEGIYVRFINYSIGGSTTKTALPRLKDMTTKDQPNILLIELGTNDVLTGASISTLYRQLIETIDAAVAQNLKVLLGTVDFSYTNFVDAKRNDELLAMYEALKEQYPQLLFFPVLTPELLNNPIYFSTDAIHSNAKGHQWVARELYPLLKPLLTQEAEPVKTETCSTSTFFHPTSQRSLRTPSSFSLARPVGAK